ncbi:MAG: PcfJ domain-containing protein [Tunicatimonas sp.]
MGNRTKHLSRQKRLAYIQHQNERELAFAKTLAERKPAHKSWKQRIEAFYHHAVPEEQLVTTIDRELHQLFSAMAAKKLAQRICFRALLLHLDQQKCQKLLQDPDYLTGLFALSSHVPTIRQPVKTWRRTSHNTEKQFVSLINHCFVRYAVPPFFYRVWLDAKKTTQQRWFIDLAQGKSIRQVGKLPVAMTKKMGHFFTQAAATLTVEEALRWAQAKGMGGSDQLAQAIAGSRLSRNEFKEERLWETVIRFLVQQPEEHAPRVGEVIDYIAHAFEQNATFSMKGRTWTALWRQTEAWHEELNRERKLGGRYTWEASGIAERVVTKGSGNKVKTYRLMELCSSKALATEGRKMRHCVSSYAHVCYKQRSAIFSLRVRDQLTAEESTLATIEVDLRQRRVVQAKARFNAPISAPACQMMEEWAKEEKLTLSPWL